LPPAIRRAPFLLRKAFAKRVERLAKV
jgi:hypothetical protein